MPTDTSKQMTFASLRFCDTGVLDSIYSLHSGNLIAYVLHQSKITEVQI